MTAARLADRRILIVGASAGIGRAVARAASEVGARVAVAARRRDRLDELVAQLGSTAMATECDVRDGDAVPAAVDRVVEQFGGLDDLVYAAAVTKLGALDAAGADEWHEVLDTNLVGASLALRAAVPHLARSGGRAYVLSSDSVAYPFPGLGPYAASKAALDKMIEAWRGEHDDVGFVRVIIGPTTTDAAAAWDPTLSASYFQLWADRGLLRDGLVPQSPDEVAERLVAVLADPTAPDDVELLPPGMASVLERGR
jgi:NAD(P)-dependent dehydrogenase (short-subunit alcohol dehydrogenase family)